MDNNQKRGNWGSRFGYIMAAAGFSIGLGNIWRFPYLVGTSGGGAFVLVYILIIALIGFPLFFMEVSLGRKTQRNPVDGMRSLTKKGSPWVLFGWLGVIAAFLILSYYMQIMGWVINYVIKMASGQLNGLDAAGYSAIFSDFMASPSSLMLFMAIGMIIVGIISSLGLNAGLEKSCSVMMPTLFIMLIFLAIRSLTLPGAMEGLKWYLTVDFSKINSSVLLAAVGQAFFSIGIASGGGFIYGSYLKKDSNIPVDATMIVGFDAIAALIAGLVIFPAIFALGMQPDAGASLMFITMSNLFSKIAFGQLFGTMFFVLIFFAALTSALGYLEPVVVTLEEVFHIDRKKSIWLSLIAIFVAGIPSVMAQGPWKEFTILGKSFFSFVDFLSGDIMMPLGALVLVFFTIFVWKFDNFKNDINTGATIIKVENYWKPIIVLVVPIALVWIFSSGILPLFL